MHSTIYKPTEIETKNEQLWQEMSVYLLNFIENKPLCQSFLMNLL